MLCIRKVRGIGVGRTARKLLLQERQILGFIQLQIRIAVRVHQQLETGNVCWVPVNNKIGIAALLESTDDYFQETGRRVTYEYVLLGNLNDAPEHAHQLVNLLKHRAAHVNVIPMNHVETLPFVEPNERRKHEFIAILEAGGIPATIRKRKGADIDAACGQLRLKQEQQLAATE